MGGANAVAAVVQNEKCSVSRITRSTAYERNIRRDGRIRSRHRTEYIGYLDVTERGWFVVTITVDAKRIIVLYYYRSRFVPASCKTKRLHARCTVSVHDYHVEFAAYSNRYFRFGPGNRITRRAPNNRIEEGNVLAPFRIDAIVPRRGTRYSYQRISNDGE